MIKKYTSLLLLLSFLSLPSFGMAAEITEHPKYITIQTKYWDELKANNSRLVLKLAELDSRLELLKMPSTELVVQLTVAKAQLTKSQQALTLSSKRLQNAEALQKETLSSLMQLQQKIAEERKAEQKTKDRLRRQRTLAWCVAGTAIMYAVKKH